MEQPGKYARVERERRYLLRGLPAEIGDEQPRLITDHYIVGASLRLRHVKSLETGESAWKLTQKFAIGDDGTRCSITNIYLTEAEFQLFANLDAFTVVKRRYHVSHGGHAYCVDVFEGRLDGLVLAEVECETDDEMSSLTMPPFAVADVTDDPFFTGGALSAVAADELRERLRSLLPIDKP